ncbi:MAG TPA: hypothetical protein VGJ28_12040 [Micromonosporaceae bacterium]|jgi:hypothetical protein
MASNRRTYRDVNGVRVEGTWRPVFIRNGSTYFLTDLLIYADGVIDCWEATDLAGLAEKLRTGSVAISVEDNGYASAHALASWRFGSAITRYPSIGGFSSATWTAVTCRSAF